MSNKIQLNNNAFVYPMPMVLVGSVIDGKPNFITVAWINRVNGVPPMIAISLAKSRYTNKGIWQHQEFSVNIPSTDLLSQTDYCGLISGQKNDKSKLFKIFHGSLANAPMISECPITMECKVVQTITLPTNELFIAEIVGAYSEEKYLTNNKPDITKIKPFTLTMPDNGYWAVGEHIGQAWSIGKKETI
jgi:flavin reductase (DIM6/NTAB) family NADH-FMN oxidoreductase RutF